MLWGNILHVRAAAAAAKLLQSCLTLCDPIDGSPPGSPIPGILQARTLEWVAISFSNARKWKVKVKSLSRVLLFATPWTAVYQDPPSMGFSRQEYWSGTPLPSPTLGQCSFNSGVMQKSRDFPSLLRPPLFLLSKGECRGISTVWQYDSNSAIQLSHLQKLENWSWWIIPKEKEMATHSSILAWKIPQRNLASYSPWGTKSRTQLSI